MEYYTFFITFYRKFRLIKIFFFFFYTLSYNITIIITLKGPGPVIVVLFLWTTSFWSFGNAQFQISCAFFKLFPLISSAKTHVVNISYYADDVTMFSTCETENHLCLWKSIVLLIFCFDCKSWLILIRTLKCKLIQSPLDFFLFTFNKNNVLNLTKKVCFFSFYFHNSFLMLKGTRHLFNGHNNLIFSLI